VGKHAMRRSKERDVGDAATVVSRGRSVISGVSDRRDKGKDLGMFRTKKILQRVPRSDLWASAEGGRLDVRWLRYKTFGRVSVLVHPVPHF
jgi:hypothetical protein